MLAEKRQAALDWASRGFRVFPLQPGSKLPYRNSDWTRTATNERAIVERLWTDPATGAPLQHNIGVLCDEMIVVDVDVKNIGEAEARFSLFELNLPDTLVVKTPSGGWHHYLTGPNVALSVGKLGKGIDIRSHHGYVVAPGSELDPSIPANKGVGGRYSVESDRPVAKAPLGLVARCDAPAASRGAGQAVVELDLPMAVNEAAIYLDTIAPAAIEGAGGDNTTYRVACHVRDLGVSSPIALKLMWERWNERCSPPWGWDELERKVSNAFSYGQNDAGAKAPAHLFQGMGDVAAIEAPVPPKSMLQGRPRKWRRPAELPDRPFILDTLLCRKLVTVLAATGSSGKTNLALTIAAHVAEGRSYAGLEVMEPTRSLFISCEDDRDELELRMAAICDTFGFDPNTLADKVYLEEALEWKLAGGGGRLPTILEHEVEAIVEICSRERIGLLIIDPMRKIHSCDENDSLGMDIIMTALTRIARRTNAAIMLLHHSGRKGERKTAGEADASRGSSAITDASRIMATLTAATTQDVELGVPRADIGAYSRLDIAKINIAEKPDKPIWFKKTSVTYRPRLRSFAMVPVTIEKRVKDEAQMIVEDVLKHVILVDGPQAYPIRSVAQKLFGEVPGYDEMNGTTEKDKISTIISKLKTVFKREGQRVKHQDTVYVIRHVVDTSGGGEARHLLKIE